MVSDWCLNWFQNIFYNKHHKDPNYLILFPNMVREDVSKETAFELFFFSFVALILQTLTYTLNLVSSTREMNQGSPQQQS